MKECSICITTIGLHFSNVWKLGEYVSQGKAIITEKMIYEVNGNFNKGDNYLEFESPDELVDQVNKILSNKKYMKSMMNKNNEYYRMYLAPDKVVFNALKKSKVWINENNKKFFWNSSYQMIIILLPLITAPYITRVLGPKGVGIYSFTGSVVQYFVLFALLGNYIYGNREIAIYQNDKKQRSQVFWGINFVTWGVAFIIFIIYILFITYTEQYKMIYIIQSILIFASLFDISWYFQGRENFKIIVIRNLLVKLTTIILIFLFVNTKSDLLLYISLMSLGTLFGNLSLWGYLKNEIYPPIFKNMQLKKHFKSSLLLFLPALISQFYLIANKIMIGSLDSVTNAGFFAQSDTIVRMILTVITSLSIVMLPNVTNLLSRGNIEAVKKKLKLVLKYQHLLQFRLALD